MAGWRHAVELAMADAAIRKLTEISRSRTEAASRVAQAQCCSGTLRSRRSTRWDEVSVGSV